MYCYVWCVEGVEELCVVVLCVCFGVGEVYGVGVCMVGDCW